MFRHLRHASMVALPCLSLLCCSAGDRPGIPERIGEWRVDVGPPGNEFYKAPPPPEEAAPPSPSMLEQVRRIAPDYTEVQRWELQDGDRYFIRSEAAYEEYDFILSLQGDLLELEYENDRAAVEEVPGEMIIEGTRQVVPASEVPESATRLLQELYPGSPPYETWKVSTAAGTRFVVVQEGRAFFARPDGQIQAVGLVERGALNEVAPPTEPDTEQIRADAAERLGPYQEKFSVARGIERLGEPPDPDEGFRFVVLGDSRSNPGLWPNIVKHIDLLDPRPVFAINTGDIVRHGYTDELLDYYIPPLLETDIPFFVALGNHDDGDDARAIEYRTLFGPDSLNFSFDYGGWRFILIDNVTGVRPYEETLDWLKETLEETPGEMPVIVAAHRPISTVEKWAYHSWDETSSRAFADLMSDHDVEHVFFGHIHAYSTARFQGVDYTIAGGGGAGLHDRYGPSGSVYHYVICDVRPDGTLTQQVVRFHRDDDEQAR